MMKYKKNNVNINAFSIYAYLIYDLFTFNTGFYFLKKSWNIMNISTEPLMQYK